mgnify:CR=1 FL=1
MSSDLKFQRNLLYKGCIIKLNMLLKLIEYPPEEFGLISIPPTEYSTYIINIIVTIERNKNIFIYYKFEIILKYYIN